MTAKYYPPQFGEDSFNCPHCGVYAKQSWFLLSFYHMGYNELKELEISVCTHCNIFALWLNKNMIEPNTGGVPLPNQDLSSEIIADYNEARDILNKSPRGSAAIMRLAIQKLCKELGENGKNINDDIAELVKKGLPVKVQQALDYVRVIGNNAVHPGQLDLKDDTATALQLFSLINLIADVMITQPKEVDKLYSSLPKELREAVLKRDKKGSV